MNNLHKLISNMLSNDGIILGDFYNLLQTLEVAPSFNILNNKGEYHDRFRYDLNDRFPIQLDVGLRCRLRVYPLKALGEFIFHLERILNDAKMVKKFLEDNGIEETLTIQKNECKGFDVMADKIYSDLYGKIATDPLGFKARLEEKKQDIMIMRNGRTVWNTLIEFSDSLINDGVKK